MITNMILSLIPALIAVESEGNPLAVSDNGKALGILQIHQCVVDDVNRVHGTQYTWASTTNSHIAQRLCVMYLPIFATRRRLGREPTLEDLARIWNGGPNGYRKKCTREYWRRVQLKLKNP